MRGEHHRAENFFNYLRLEDRIPENHPLRVATGLLGQLPATFVAVRAAGCVQVFGRRSCESIPALGQPASENLHTSRHQARLV
jgi:hypothetical protein